MEIHLYTHSYTHKHQLDRYTHTNTKKYMTTDNMVSFNGVFDSYGEKVTHPGFFVAVFFLLDKDEY